MVLGERQAISYPRLSYGHEAMSPFRYLITSRNVRRGVQSQADLDSIERHGVVTRPTEDLSRSLTREQAKSDTYAKRQL